MTKIELPQHQAPNPEREAHAPYNFVPLPEAIVEAEAIPSHDEYHKDRLTGYIDCTLTTLSPMYTRCMMTPEQFEQFSTDSPSNKSEEEERKRVEEMREKRAPFFYIDDIEEPVIPGSSLRGMIRSLVEIVGYGKIHPVTKRKPFFRTVDTSALGKHYRITRKMTKGDIKTGFLRQDGSGQYYIKPCKRHRVHYDLLGKEENLFIGQKRPNMRPGWTPNNAGFHQYQKVNFKLEDNQAVGISPFSEESDGLVGILIIPGKSPPNPPKERAFVFVLPDDDDEKVDVDEALIDRFHDSDQITQWQEKAFPINTPVENGRSRPGFLSKDLSGDGDPVFFLQEGGQLVFFGRALMFRLPYKQGPFEFVPNELRVNEDDDDNKIDIAEAVFGFVRDSKTEGSTQAQAGRVFFTNAHYQSDLNGVWLNNQLATSADNIITPPILSSPKPTSFQHYLVQNQPDNKDSLKHYDDKAPQKGVVGDSAIRGHKQYWHRHTTQEDITADSEEAKRFFRQYTRIQPVKEGVTFGFKIYFENLSKVEAGALLWVLNLPAEHYHKLGMGKPLGMGSVAIKASLFENDRNQRYETLFISTKDNWETGFQENAFSTTREDSLKRKFEKHVLREIGDNPDDPDTSLSTQKRISELLTMLNGAITPNRSQTDYFDKPEKFKERKVLPTPQGVVDRAQEQGQVLQLIDPQIIENAQQCEPVKWEYNVGDLVEGRIVQRDWPGGKVEVTLTNGERGLLNISQKRFKRSQNQTLKMTVVEIKRGCYHLKLG